MIKFFSRTNRQGPEVFATELNEVARARIWQTYAQMLHVHTGSIGVDLYTAVGEIWNTILREFPTTISKDVMRLNLRTPEQIIPYYLSTCSSEHVVDVIQMMLNVQGHVLYHTIGPKLIEEVNRIFREEGIGYELTPLKVEMITHSGPRPGFGPYGGEYQTAEYTEPEIIPFPNDFTRAEITEPALSLLSDKRFATANRQMMDAYKHCRKGEYDDAIVACHRSFETFLKTVCTEKGWSYKANVDTLAALIEVCNSKGLFYPFYIPHFTSVGTIGNKLGRHGAEPKPEFIARKEHVHHLLHVTSSCMLFLNDLL